MKAVILACQAFKDTLHEKITRVHVDNNTVVSHLKKEGGTRSQELTNMTRDLFWYDRNKIQVQAVHIVESTT